MRYLVVAALAAALAGSVAQADEQAGRSNALPPDHSADMAVGVGVICNTTEQAEHFVQLRATGTEIARAMNEVNEEANDPRACGMAAIAFKRDKTVDTKSVNGKLISIVRVDVLAGFDGHKWSPVPAMTQYAIMEDQGIAI